MRLLPLSLLLLLSYIIQKFRTQMFLFARSGLDSIKTMHGSSLRRAPHRWVWQDLTEETVNEKRGIENEAEEQQQVEAEGCRMRTEKQCFIMHSHPSLSH